MAKKGRKHEGKESMGKERMEEAMFGGKKPAAKPKRGGKK